MVGWIVRIAGMMILLAQGNVIAAVVIVIALIVANNQEEGSRAATIIDLATLIAGLYVLFSLSFWVGIVALVLVLAPATVEIKNRR